MQPHTVDNVITYVERDKILFGGCLVKTMDAGKGNLEDANENAWPNTIQQIKKKYQDIRYVVPGHGKYGDDALLDYTIELFSE